MSGAGEKNDNRPDQEEAIPTASFGAGVAGPGGQIGPYKLLSVLGEGGFAVVYLAEQQGLLKRRVALKVIKPGMDTKQVSARWRRFVNQAVILSAAAFRPSLSIPRDAGSSSRTSRSDRKSNPETVSVE